MKIFNNMETGRDFTRTRILSFPVPALMILNTLKQSLSIEIQNFFTYAIRGGSCTKQAFSKQRVKLEPEFFHSCNRVLLSGFYRHYREDVKRWKGRLLFAVDGSTLPASPNGCVDAGLRQATNQCVSDMLKYRVVRLFLEKDKRLLVRSLEKA